MIHYHALSNCFPLWLCQCTNVPNSVVQDNFFWSTALPIINIVMLLGFSHSSMCKLLVSHVVLICISLITDEIGHFFPHIIIDFCFFFLIVCVCVRARAHVCSLWCKIFDGYMYMSVFT